MNRNSWSKQVGASEAARRVGGRKRYNAERQRAMWARRFQILRIYVMNGDQPRGAQRALAERL